MIESLIYMKNPNGYDRKSIKTYLVDYYPQI